jgi:FtsP/CotA-like multicopper oxidase with cupredoxin domain
MRAGRFEVVSREDWCSTRKGGGQPSAGQDITPRTLGVRFKDTVIAYPGQVTRVKVRFDHPGQFVWHCHIVEHEDNEMMRPYRIGPVQPGQPGA